MQNLPVVSRVLRFFGTTVFRNLRPIPILELRGQLGYLVSSTVGKDWRFSFTRYQFGVSKGVTLLAHGKVMPICKPAVKYQNPLYLKSTHLDTISRLRIDSTLVAWIFHRLKADNDETTLRWLDLTFNIWQEIWTIHQNIYSIILVTTIPARPLWQCWSTSTTCKQIQQRSRSNS